MQRFNVDVVVDNYVENVVDLVHFDIYRSIIIRMFMFLLMLMLMLILFYSILFYYIIFYFILPRVLLVLLHDFPEFLCDYHYGFCDVIPPNCIQMRNLILSAFPRSMRLPDPFTPNLKVILIDWLIATFLGNLQLPDPLHTQPFETYKIAEIKLEEKIIMFYTCHIKRLGFNCH